MGMFSRFMMQRTPLPTPVVTERFDAITDADIPPEFFGLTSYTSDSAKVSRREAIQVPAVKRGRDLICATLGTIPLDLIGPDGKPDSVYSELLRQPERGIPRSVTITKTLDQMLFDGVAWWLVTEYGWHKYPIKVVRLESGVDVVQQARQYVTKMGHHGQVTRYDEDFDLIRFDSPNDPLLVAGARAIRTHIALDQAVRLYSGGNQPLDYLSPAEGEEDPDEAELDVLMADWETSRRQRSTAWLPKVLKYNTAGWNPEQLELAEQRDHASKELATLMGIQAERVNVSTTSRTYSNIQQDRQELVDMTLNTYAEAMRERLEMGDVTPRGYTPQWRWAEFLRTDDKTRMEIATAGKTGGVLDAQEARNYFDPKLPVAATAQPKETASDPANA